MSLKFLLKRYIPKRKHIQEHKHLRHFGDWLHDPNIWHLTRRSSAGGVAIGLFWAMMPIPGQTIAAAATAIFLRLNLPLSIIFVWVTNPITAAPVYYLAYKLGSVLLNEPIQNVAFEFSMHWMTETLIHIWQPLIAGCLLLGVCSAAIGSVTIRILWRILLLRKWEQRRISRSNRY
jgi:uncharacterized protein